MTYTLPDLEYGYGDLAPHFDEATMRLHHTKHHQTYVDKLNDALDKYPELAGVSLVKILADFAQVPEDIRTAVRNHGGGHFNHSFFWQVISPASSNRPASGKLATALISKWGSVEDFQTEFSERAASVFGSGWAWLGLKSTELIIMTTTNQDTPIASGVRPLLGLDVWEHAYYLTYQNRRAEYVEHFWPLVNWEKVETLYVEALNL